MGADWHGAMKPDQRRLLDQTDPAEAAEKRKASVRTKTGHPFLCGKRLFGNVKVRNWGLAKHTLCIALLPGFANLLIAGRDATG